MGIAHAQEKGPSLLKVFRKELARMLTPALLQNGLTGKEHLMNAMHGVVMTGLIVVLSGAMSTSAADKKDPPTVPDLTEGGTMDHALNWTLGSTGARGWIYRYRNSTENARQICVTEVDTGSPADGVLNVGDVILGVSGTQPAQKDRMRASDGAAPFPHDARKALAAAITEAEKRENGGKLSLLRWRDGKTETVTLQLKVMGSFSETAPYACEKSEKIIEMAVAALKEDGLDHGNPNPIDGDGIPGLFNALGLMATGRDDAMPMVAAKMKQIAEVPIDGMKWGHAWSLITLAEYYLRSGDESVLPAIERYALETAKGQSIAGTWGHGFAAEDGILGGYGAMNQVSIAHTIGLILAKECGVKAPVVQHATARSVEFFDYYVGKGSVPYGAHEAGDQFGPDDNGKSSGCAVAFNLYGHKKGTEFLSRFSVYDFSRIEVGHASNFFHLPWQGLASAQLGPEAAAAHMRECRWYYELLRDWRGKYRHHEDPNHNEPNTYWDATGARLLFLCLPRKQLYLTGKGGYLAEPVRGQALEAIVESGRYDGHYDTLSTTQLMARLGDWCHATRYRAAQELAKREGDRCTPCLPLYTDGTMEQKYGAARVFQALKEKAAPAVDPLIENIEHPDLWLRIRTVHALGEIGEPARKAVPALLQAVTLEDPDDSRNMFRRAIAMALFAKNSGLMASQDVLASVPEKDLVAALKILLKTEEGQSVTALAQPLTQLSFEALQPLWPEIVYRIEHRLSENVMFANMQTACLDLLAEHKIEEGLQLAPYMLFAQNGWGSGRRNEQTLAALRKYGVHARRTFFALQLYLQKDLGFSAPLQTFKKELAQATEKPELKSIAPWLGDYLIGDYLEKQLTLRELRKKIETDDLAVYWTTYEMIQKLLTMKPDWGADTQSVLDEMMSIPRAKEIVGAHLAIEAIKQSVKAGELSREQAIEKLIEYRDTYDINDRGPNLVYWYALMWSDTLKAGKDLK